MTELVLGSAQWGMTYGVTNRTGQLQDQAIKELAQVAKNLGIRRIDTAVGYGNAEDKIGSLLSGFLVSSKVSGRDSIETQIRASQRRLRSNELDTVLVHDWDALGEYEREEALDSLAVLQAAGEIASFGVSTYDLDGVCQAVMIVERSGAPLGALQVPANPVDRRLDHADPLSVLSEKGSAIYVRSIFLQGVLLDPTSPMAQHPDVRRFHREVDARPERPTYLEVCLAHAKSFDWLSHLVVGVASTQEFEEVARAFEDVKPERSPVAWSSEDLKLIDPRRWQIDEVHVH